MNFKGLSVIFSTKNNKQFEHIGKFWEEMSLIFGRENLRGLGFNWTDSTIEYVIGLKNNSIINLKNIEQITKSFPNAKQKNVQITNQGWKTYKDKTKNLANLYKKIYKEGSLTYEIECFDSQGNCEIQITRQKL